MADHFQILQVRVSELLWNERYYMPQETGNYSVAGFKVSLITEKKFFQLRK